MKKSGVQGHPMLDFSQVNTHFDSVFGSVHCGLQDRAGNLWFGTTGAGVFRYDGKTFRNFTVKDGLSSNSVFSILEDGMGNIWVGCDAGVCRYDGKTISPVPFKTAGDAYLPTNNYAIATPAPNCMLQDRAGRIWMGTNKGVYWYEAGHFTLFLHNDHVANTAGLRLNSVQAIIEDKQGNIWFTTWFEGVCRYDGKSITNFKPNGEVWFAGLHEDRKGNIWVGRRTKGVCKFDGAHFSNVSQHGRFDSCGVNVILEDHSGNIWLGTEAGDMERREAIGGIWKYDGKTFKNFTTKDGLSNMSVFSGMVDKSGALWLGTRGMGLCRFDGTAFSNYTR